MIIEELVKLKLPYPATFTKASPDGKINETTLSYSAAEVIQEFITTNLQHVLRQLKQVYVPHDPHTEGLCLSIRKIKHMIE